MSKMTETSGAIDAKSDSSFDSSDASDRIEAKIKPSVFKEYRAVKIFSKALMNERTDNPKFFNEITILSQFVKEQHPAIIDYFHYFDEPKRFMLVQEFCPIGDFHKQLEQRGGSLDLS